MITKGAQLSFNFNKTCFITIPRDWVEFKTTNQIHKIFKICNSSSELYVSWGGVISEQDGVCSINGIFASQAGFKHNDDVIVSGVPYDQATECSQVFIEPCSTDDWEILELNTQKIEDELLSQLCVVTEKLIFPVWIDKIYSGLGRYPTPYKGGSDREGRVTMEIVRMSWIQVGFISISLGSLDNYSQCSLLSNSTSLVISPSGRSRTSSHRVNQPTADATCTPPIVVEQNASFLENVYTYISSILFGEAGQSRHRKLCIPTPRFLVQRLRVQRLELAGEPSPLNTVYVNQYCGFLRQFGVDGGLDSFLVEIVAVASPAQIDSKRKSKHKSEKEDIVRNKIIVKVVIVNEKIRYIHPEIDHIIIDESIRRHLGVGLTGKVDISPFDDGDFINQNSITLIPLGNMPSDVSLQLVELSFRSLVKCTDHPLVINNGSVICVYIKPDLNVDCAVVFDDEFGEDSSLIPFTVLTSDQSSILSVTVTRERTLLPNYLTASDSFCDPLVPRMSIKQLGGVDEICTDILRRCTLCLSSRPLSTHLASETCDNSIRLLITGTQGCGKSSIGQALCNQLSQAPCHCFTEIVKCRQYKGKKLEFLKHFFTALLREARFRSSSVILLDDIDHMMPISDENEVPDDLRSYRIAELLKDVFTDVANKGVCLLATCQSTNSVHESITQNNLFHSVYELKSPNMAARTSILQTIIDNIRLTFDCDLSRIAKSTEGYECSDLLALVEKAEHANVSTKLSVGCLRNEDFVRALEDHRPVSLRSVNLDAPYVEVEWSQIGGLKSIKDTLLEVVEWPVKYHNLYKDCPIRLKTGILLYGPSGTGKSILAKAIAEHAKLNFLIVKGPELLNKYIGASEQAVREIFSRASSAKPCLLFFDEFDSLAPKRGHDSTGVTDRVVNQFLTEMDGVVSLQGVYVLAATNRPDLIDRALLRPGRLDKLIHCPMPDQEDRFEILQLMTKSMNLNQDVDLLKISKITKGFTGADLKAMLYTAQLESIREELDNSSIRTNSDIVSENTNKISDQYIYLTSIQEGTQELPASVLETIINERNVIEETSFKEDTKLKVTMDHMIQSSNCTIPSVSQTEIDKHFAFSMGTENKKESFGTRETLT